MNRWLHPLRHARRQGYESGYQRGVAASSWIKIRNHAGATLYDGRPRGPVIALAHDTVDIDCHGRPVIVRIELA